MWHAYADRPGDGSYLKTLTPHPRGVEVGILGCQKIKSPGNAMNCPEMQYIFLTHSTPGGGGPGGVAGQNFKSAGNFTNCRENR